MKKKIIIIIAVIIAIVIMIAGYVLVFMNPYHGTTQDKIISKPLDYVLSESEAKEDIKQFYRLLKSRHPAWLDGSKDVTDKITAQYEAELEAVGDNTSVLELWQALSRITNIMRDGHTGVWHKSEDYLYINSFEEIQAFGMPRKVNDTYIDELLDEYKKLGSYELEAYAEHQFYKNIISESFLRLCGVDTTNGVTLLYDIDVCKNSYEYEFVPLDDVLGKSESSDANWVRYTIDADNNTAVFILDSCSYNDEYKTVLNEFFAEVFENDIHNIIVDLRNNGGGHSYVANEFLKYVDVDEYKLWDSYVRYSWYLKKSVDESVINQKKSETFSGDIYVLTSTKTYSSAMDFAMMIGDNDIGSLVGEASGNLPDSYGDLLIFELKNSSLKAFISYKKWFRIDKSKVGQPLTPDYEVPAKDALDEAYRIIKASK